MAMIMGTVLLTVSSCGQAKNTEDAQTDVNKQHCGPGGSTGEVQKTQNDINIPVQIWQNWKT